MGAVYPITLRELWKGNVDVDGGTLSVVPVDSGYSYSATDDFYDDITSTVGSPKTIGSQTYDAGLLDGDGVTFDDVAAADHINGLVFFLDTGTPATSRLIAFHDENADTTPMDFTSTGADIDADWPAGIAQL